MLSQSVCNDGAGIAENLLINKMMINWAEKQAPEESSSNRGRIDAMTHNTGLRSQEKLLSSLRTSSITGQPRVIKAVTMLQRGRLGRSQGEPQTKGELECEDVQTSCKACKTYIEDGPQL